MSSSALISANSERLRAEKYAVNFYLKHLEQERFDSMVASTSCELSDFSWCSDYSSGEDASSSRHKRLTQKKSSASNHAQPKVGTKIPALVKPQRKHVDNAKCFGV